MLCKNDSYLVILFGKRKELYERCCYMSLWCLDLLTSLVYSFVEAATIIVWLFVRKSNTSQLQNYSLTSTTDSYYKHDQKFTFSLSTAVPSATTHHNATNICEYHHQHIMPQKLQLQHAIFIIPIEATRHCDQSLLRVTVTATAIVNHQLVIHAILCKHELLRQGTVTDHAISNLDWKLAKGSFTHIAKNNFFAAEKRNKSNLMNLLQLSSSINNTFPKLLIQQQLVLATSCRN